MSSQCLTFTGRHVDPLNLQASDVDIRDIAAALSKMCRFNGHVRDFYSIGQHSVLVSEQAVLLAVKGLGTAVSIRTAALFGLLHDASEAYIADIIQPVKHTVEFTEYRQIEARIQAAVCERFAIPLDNPFPAACVKRADEILLAAEFRDLVPHADAAWAAQCTQVSRIRPLLPERAELLFLRRFTELTEARHAA